jgi:hypothetical protein
MSKYSFAVEEQTKNQCLFFGLTTITMYAALSQLLQHQYLRPEISNLIILGWTAGIIADILNIDLIKNPIHYFLFLSFVNIPYMLFLTKL